MIRQVVSLRSRSVVSMGAVIVAAATISLAYAASEPSKPSAPNKPGVYTSYDPPEGFKPGLEFVDAPAGQYKLDPQHSHLIFQMAHYGGLSRPIMRFRKLDADYTWDPAHPEKTQVEARINVSSFESGDRDHEIRMQAPDVLRGYDNGENGKYRYITFASKEIRFTGKTPDGRHKGTMTGDLTLIGVTKPVTLDVVYNGFIQNRLGYRKMGFTATGSFDRSAFGFTTVPSAAKDVFVTMELEFMHAVSAPGVRPGSP